MPNMLFDRLCHVERLILQKEKPMKRVINLSIVAGFALCAIDCNGMINRRGHRSGDTQ